MGPMLPEGQLHKVLLYQSFDTLYTVNKRYWEVGRIANI